MDISIFVSIIVISVFLIILIIGLGRSIINEKYGGNPEIVLNFMFYFFFLILAILIVLKFVYKVKANLFVITVLCITVVTMISWRILLFKFHDINAAKAFAVVNILSLLINFIYFALFTNTNIVFIIFLAFLIIWIISMTKLTYELTHKQVLMLA
jgi:hypothetical protein